MKRGLASPRIFISYRRSDAGGYAGQLHAELKEHYGARTVWIDHADIGPGTDFAEELDSALARSDVLLAIIGPDWLSATKDGQLRLHNPDDWVRREIVTGLRRSQVAVTPVLVGGAPLPNPEQLPDELSPLVGRQAVEVRPGEHFDRDVEALVRRLGGWRRYWHGFPLWAWASGVVVVATALVLAFLLRMNAPPVVTPQLVQAVGGLPISIDVAPWVEDERPNGLQFFFEGESVHGGLVEGGEGGLALYTGPVEYRGVDTFEFTVTDDRGAVTPATANVMVALGRLGGAFNVAIAEFTASGDDQPAVASLGRSLFEQLETLEEEAGVDIDVAPPDLVGPLPGDTPEDQAEGVADLAERIAADVIVFGNLDVEEGFAELSAEFYLSGRGLTEAGELAGVYALDSLELQTSDPLALSQAASQLLRPKIEALTRMAIGLSNYQLYRYGEAEALFLEASEAWPGSASASNGREVVFHLLGNVRGLQGDLDGAEEQYLLALELNPDYPRSRFGVAEIRYQRARGAACGGQGESDPDALRTARSQFEEVVGMPAPPQSFLSERALVEIARIDVCLGELERARVTLDEVIPLIEGERRLRDLYAEALVTLGAYHLRVGDPLSAATEFETAARTTLDPSRRGQFYSVLAHIYQCDLDQPETAESYKEEAEVLLGEPLAPIVCTASG